MAIVDLRGRERETDVLRLLDADPSWVVVGWRRDDELVACAGLERSSQDELAVRALAAEDDADARDLLNAVAAVATGARLVAEVETPRAELYRDCGFDVRPTGEDRVRCVRLLEEESAPAGSVRATTLHELEAALRSAW